MNGYDIKILITEFIEGEPQQSENDATTRLVCKTSANERIVFWGSQSEGTRNIDALKNQKLPVLVECQVYEPCDHLKERYNVAFKVPEHSWIAINPQI